MEHCRRTQEQRLHFLRSSPLRSRYIAKCVEEQARGCDGTSAAVVVLSLTPAVDRPYGDLYTVAFACIRAEFHLTAAGWYAVVVSTSIFQFALSLRLGTWLLWTFFAFKLSRSNLRLVPTHPDEHGGLGFLGLTSAAFAPIVFSATAVIGATWRQEILYHGTHLMNILVVIFALVALGPLAFFVPRLAELRRKGILEYGILGQLHSADFHEKWILHRAGREAEFLEAPDSSSLAD